MLAARRGSVVWQGELCDKWAAAVAATAVQLAKLLVSFALSQIFVELSKQEGRRSECVAISADGR